MGKYTGIVVGAVMALVGTWALGRWWGAFLLVLKGSVPVMLIFAGAIAVIAGISEMKDEAAAKKTASK